VKQHFALRRADRLFTLSNSARMEIRAQLGISEEAIAVVPLAADPLFAPRPKEAVSATLAELGLSPGQRPLVASAGASAHKDLDTLITAYAAGLDPARSPPLVVVGSPRGEGPSAIGRAQERVRNLTLDQWIRFPGFVSDERLASLFTTATAVVLPSLGEGFGLIAIEAGACGAPVILSEIGAHRETLGGAGLFFPPGDEAALRTRIDQLVGDRQRASEVGERCRDAAGRFSWDETAHALYALLAEAALPGRGRG
jgi:glycosyltransferase involved in cell wall biosynthesis